MRECGNCKHKDSVTKLFCLSCFALSNWEKAREEDVVNNPPHYKHFEKEVIDIIKETLTPAQYEGYCMGNEMKYRLRAGYKTEDFSEDMKKAMWYKKERLNGK